MLVFWGMCAAKWVFLFGVGGCFLGLRVTVSPTVLGQIVVAGDYSCLSERKPLSSSSAWRIVGGDLSELDKDRWH